MQGVGALYILCESRNKLLYIAIFRKIIQLAPNLLMHLIIIISDYEKATIAAEREVFDNPRIVGCWIHNEMVNMFL